ncbi:glutamate--tRNA ligase [Sphingomonas sp. CGMCC 1.13654]|uniref:Glutamate--tRNA ligase n=1 Tax=Sphingomonas chungangi TaxID=2683589 RepID=A0A838L9F1_9SPHN|nr:glutamate--tRNA ligase [Sphingomonas chungangi]MBA2935422.1 glutamate--tRNA ligase [Sphingomonas chungangi]MVW56929.1 glutamate--tRNA ligase [Sphingomonas chungangi]
MTVITRFAPSPTGKLHVGNIRTALVCWMAARAEGGRFLLRLDDTDRARSTEENVVAIRRDLEWLGLVPEGEVRQSDRFALYEAAFETLHAAGRVYPCHESEEELSIKRKVALGRGLPPIYDRAALKLSAEERQKLEADGIRPHWRFRLDAAPIEWTDLIRGPQHFEGAALSDPVVRRADGSWLYLLPSVIDDIDMKISHVVRGEDHVSNTAVQIQMFEALGANIPNFAHMALLVGADGKLSKREGAIGVEAIRTDGIEPQALLGLLARIGTSEPVVPIAAPEDLLPGFAFPHMGRAPARFDSTELEQLNAKTLHLLPYAAVKDRLPGGVDETIWLAIRPNLATVADAQAALVAIEGPITAPDLAPEDRAFCAEAATAAASLDWAEAPWIGLVGVLKASTGRKGKALFLPLRLALTGRDHGPEMAALLPLIGRDRAIARLRLAAGLA